MKFPKCTSHSNDVKLLIRLKLPSPERTLRLRHMPPNSSVVSSFRKASLAAVLACSLGMVACNDPLRVSFNFPNSDQPFRVFALSGAHIADPNGMFFAGRSVVRIDGNFAFDLAFDIDPLGRPVILPASLVGTPISGATAIGLKRVDGNYLAVTEAPRDGYVFDSVMVVQANKPVVIQAQQGQCASSFTPYIFVKIVFDSVNAVDRTMFGRTMINLNCGSRQLTPGVPKF